MPEGELGGPVFRSPIKGQPKLEEQDRPEARRFRAVRAGDDETALRRGTGRREPRTGRSNRTRRVRKASLRRGGLAPSARARQARVSAGGTSRPHRTVLDRFAGGKIGGALSGQRATPLPQMRRSDGSARRDERRERWRNIFRVC